MLKTSGLPLPAARRLAEESRQDWVEATASSSPRTPDYRPRYHRRAPLLGQYPQLIDAATLGRVKPLAVAYAECASTRGSLQPLVSRFTGKPVTVALEADKKPVAGGEGASLYTGTWRENIYYPSPEMQEDAARALERPCRAVMQRADRTAVS